MGLAIVAVLVLGLLGGLFHHHESESESAACSFCHAGVQIAVADPAGALGAPFFEAVGSIAPTWPSRIPRIVHYVTLVPRAPPATTHSVVFGEGAVDVSN